MKKPSFWLDALFMFFTGLVGVAAGYVMVRFGVVVFMG